MFQIVATLLWDFDKLDKPLLDYATDHKVCYLPERHLLTYKGNAKRGKDAKFHLFALKTCQSRRQEYPKHKYTKTNKDKDKISPILPERDLPRPLSNAGSCSSNYSTAPTSPLKKEAIIFLLVIFTHQFNLFSPFIRTLDNKTLPKAQRTRGLSSSFQSNLLGHITSSNTNLDQTSSSKSRPSIHFKIHTKHHHLN